jgi:hypothetical protein
MADGKAPRILPEGQLVKLSGLKSASHLNNQRGKISQVLASTGRYAVTLSDGKSVSVKFSNVEAMEPAEASCNNVLKIEPVTEGDCWGSESLARAISQVDFPLSTEFEEKQRLRRDFRYKNPQLLFAYSEKAKYADLVVYFDHGDKESPINHAATKAFRCYGLSASQAGVDWKEIRGSCLVFRQGPPKTLTMSGKIEQLKYEFQPYIHASEMVETLQFFTDKDARQVALTRDAHRSGFSAHPTKAPAQAMYFGTGTRTGKKMAADEALKCQSCGMARFLSGALKTCPCGEVRYCSQNCQKTDWTEHKKVCKWRLEHKKAEQENK